MPIHSFQNSHSFSYHNCQRMQLLSAIKGFWPHIQQALMIDTDYLSFLNFQFNPGLLNSNTTLFNASMTPAFEFVKRHMIYARTPHGSDHLRLQVHIAHGVLATVTIIILFPTVAILLRLISSPHIVRIHWMLQLFNVGILLVVFGLGCWLSWLDGWVSSKLSVIAFQILTKTVMALASSNSRHCHRCGFSDPTHPWSRAA
jgi:hypothetical protein